MKSNYKIAHTFVLAFRKRKSLKFDLLGVISGSGFSSPDVKRCLIGILWHSIRFLEAQGHETSRFWVIYKNSGEGHFDPHKILLRCELAFPLRNI